jgi:hypothetical protein
LSGGAGTRAFLVGCGWFEGRAFVTRQFLLTNAADEPAMLNLVAQSCGRAGALVTFNGKSFDAPVLETRYLFHRLDWNNPLGSLPHVDMLHPSRRFWGNRVAATTCGFESSEGRCSLVALEQQVLDVRRNGDVMGFQVPDRYFRFIRSGDARPLAAVLEHNRLDLLSLAGLTARLLALVHGGPAVTADPGELLALGRLYARSGHEARAREAFERTVTVGAGSPAAIDALRGLALTERRHRRHDEAARLWQEMLDLPRCPPDVRREATRALAIHNEHRVRDLGKARRFALESLAHGRDPAWEGAIRYRLARLDRKMGALLD